MSGRFVDNPSLRAQVISTPELAVAAPPAHDHWSMPQSIWKGSISFGLVSIPVRLFSRDRGEGHLLPPGPPRRRRPDPLQAGLLGRRRGGALQPTSPRATSCPTARWSCSTTTTSPTCRSPRRGRSRCSASCRRTQIDAVQMGKPYYCDPTGDAKPYVLLRDALENAERVAVVKVALRQRERLAMLRPRDGVLVLQTLLWPDEVREPRSSTSSTTTSPCARRSWRWPSRTSRAVRRLRARTSSPTTTARRSRRSSRPRSPAARSSTPAEEPESHRPGRRPDGGAAAQRGRGQGAPRRAGGRRRRRTRRPTKRPTKAAGEEGGREEHRRRRRPRRPPRRQRGTTKKAAAKKTATRAARLRCRPSPAEPPRNPALGECAVVSHD